MTVRPIIFISAVSRELRSARQLVANTLTFLGYQPVWQDIFGTETGDLSSVLREKIDKCKGVVQLVGQCYGVEPPTPDEEFGRVSYTQYEALYARKRGKKVWYLFIDESFPIDAHEPEPAELRELQATYRKRLQSDTHVFHPLTSSEALEASVLKLRDDLTRLRRGVKQWAVGVVALLVFLSAATIWLVQMQRRQSSAIQSQGEQVSTIIERNQKMQQALVRLAQVEGQAKQPREKLTAEEQRARAYAVLEKELGLSAGTLAKEMPGFALELYTRADTTALMRARAAYALNKFDEAEKLSLEAGEQGQKAYETANRVADDRRKAALESYELAGSSAEKRVRYADALGHLRKAERLTDRARDPLEWARVQYAIWRVLYDQDQYQQAESVLHEVLKERERLLGPEHPDTLATRRAFTSVVQMQGKFPQAEAEYRVLLPLEEKVLGPEHPEVLTARNNFAVLLNQEGKHHEAEAEHLAVIKLREKVLGPEHPHTLTTRGNLVIVLDDEGKFAEAESEARVVIKLKEKVLGPEHPGTLRTRNYLGIVLLHQGKYAQAESEARAVLKLREQVLGSGHSDTLDSQDLLAMALAKQQKFEQADIIFSELLPKCEKVYGIENPDTLTVYEDYAECLKGEGKLVQAKEFARRAAEGARKVLGPDHPSTRKYEKLLQDLEMKR